MFDTLTLDELYALHSRLAAESRATHARMMDGLTPILPVLGDEWRLLAAKCGELSETMNAVYAETARREQEARAAVCRTCGFADCPGAQTGDCPRWPALQSGPYAYVRDDQHMAGE